MTRILVVDDEVALVELVRGYLEREQYEVLTASDGRTALDLARTAQPDLVMLPELDGIEVCRQLRQFSDAYVILLTARAEEIDKLLGLTVGADDYLTKPFSPRELVARIKARLGRPRPIPVTSKQCAGSAIASGADGSKVRLRLLKGSLLRKGLNSTFICRKTSLKSWPTRPAPCKSSRTSWSMRCATHLLRVRSRWS